MLDPRESIPVNEAPQSIRPIAPLWHTVGLLLLLFGFSLLNVFTGHMTAPQHGSRALMYAVSILWEWTILGLAYWGLRMRGTSLRQVLGIRRTGAAELWIDIAIGLGFWFASLLAVSAAALLLRLVRLHPEDIRNAVSQLAPASPAELAIWIALSISAGVCEEIIFRGYFQQQFTALTRQIWLGIAIAAVIFGLSHGYEGISGVLLIVLYGSFFGVLAHFRRSLRAGMFAHAWHDSLSGIVLFFGGHLLHRIPH